jgi:hypothetical protein
MSAVTKAVGIVISESAVVRLFCHGQLVGEIIPEVDDGSCRPPARYREEGTSRRTHDSDTKSATSLDRGVSITDLRNREYDNTTGIQV